MKLAEAIQDGDKNELKALADYIVGEFDVAERNTSSDQPTPATADSIASALAAWAYMKLHAANQGD